MTIFDPEGKPIEMIDDSEVHGSDPYVVLNPPADGEYTLKINDILWRDNIQACVQVLPVFEMKPNARRSGKLRFYQFDLKKGQYLTVMPKTLEMSPAQLLMDLHEPEGGRIARFGNGDSLLQPLRKDLKDGITAYMFPICLIEKDCPIKSISPLRLRLLNWQRPFIRIFTLPSLARR